MQDLLERVIAIARCFDAAALPHSFGGAIALGYYGEVRGTRDIDINVYVGVDDAERVLRLLEGLGVAPAGAPERRRIARDAQVRLLWQAVPIDLFFSNLDFHEDCRRRCRRFALGDDEIRVLGPEDLIVCKVAFAREKDGRDIDTMLGIIGGELDIRYIRSWIEAIVGFEHPAARALDQMLERHALAPKGRTDG